jgi:integrase/recombinase XerD
MSKRDEVVTMVMNSLLDKFNDEQLDVIEKTLSDVVADYEIENRITDIVPSEDFVPSYYPLFIARKKLAGRSIGTLKLYSHYLMDFFLYKPAPIEQMDSSLMVAYLYDFQRRHNVSNRTLDSVRTVINGFFQWAANEGYVPKNFVGNIDSIKFVEKPREPLTEEEVVLLKDACVTPREQAFVNLLLSTGVRISEAANIKWDDIDFDGKTIKVFGKGSKYRTVMFDSATKLALLRYKLAKLGDSENVFSADKYPYSTVKKRALEMMMSKVAKRAKISHHVTPHVLRHTFATQALARGMSIEKLKTLLGHEDYSTTLIYAKVNLNQVESEYKRCFA